MDRRMRLVMTNVLAPTPLLSGSYVGQLKG